LQDGERVSFDSWSKAVPVRLCYQSWKSPLDPNSHTTTSPAEQVRVAFGRWVQQLTGAISEEIRETLLVRQGCYCGKRLSSQGFSGIWFVEEAQIKLLGPDGHSYGTLPISSFLQQAEWPDHKAA